MKERPLFQNSTLLSESTECFFPTMPVLVISLCHGEPCDWVVARESGTCILDVPTFQAGIIS